MNSAYGNILAWADNILAELDHSEWGRKRKKHTRKRMSMERRREALDSGGHAVLARLHHHESTA
jgi:hypothetical protein